MQCGELVYGTGKACVRERGHQGKHRSQLHPWLKCVEPGCGGKRVEASPWCIKHLTKGQPP